MHGAIAGFLNRHPARWPRSFVLFALLALGIALRVRQYAACPSYWYDEAYLLVNVFHKSFIELLGPLREDQAAPPVFLWALRGLYRFAGGSEWWMRLPALAASVLGLFVMVPLAQRVNGKSSGLWAVAFCAFAHHATAHAGEVKQYTIDFLLAELILLAGLCCPSVRSRKRAACWLEARRASEVSGSPTRQRGTHRPPRWRVGLPEFPRRRARIALCLLAVLAPWTSYPAVFVLGAASLSLLVRALQRRERSLVVFCAIFTALFVLSGLVLWQIVARHQATANLRAFWIRSFLDLSSPGAAIAWVGRCLIEIGNYGTREMGVPLLLLSLAGAVSLWRRSPARLVLLAGPLLLAMIASALQRYPLGGRLLFFLVPCVWLLAADGIRQVTRLLPVRLPWLRWVLPAGLLVPALLWAGRLFVVVTPRCQFREAFHWVAEHRAPGETLWVSHPQVQEVYSGQPSDLSAYSSPELVEQIARKRRLWVVCAVAGAEQRFTAGETMARLRAAGCVTVRRRRFRGLEVILYAPRNERPGNR